MGAVAEDYRRWARQEARGSSPQYEAWALAVASDVDLCERIGALPREKRQPNLLLAAARLNDAPSTTDEFISWLRDHWTTVRATVSARWNQTNEVARNATILLALSRIPGPVALLELGASAGLCLIPDRFGYRYRVGSDLYDVQVGERSPDLILECSLDGAKPPGAVPEIVWRAGIERNPIDAADAEEQRWLEALVWPEHDDRRSRLRSALHILATDPPHIVKGDLLVQLPMVADQAPPDATLVVMHSAVFAYLDTDERRAATNLIHACGARHISLEGASVMPGIAKQLPREQHDDPRFVLSLDGTPLGFAAPHGGSFEALEPQ